MRTPRRCVPTLLRRRRTFARSRRMIGLSEEKYCGGPAIPSVKELSHRSIPMREKPGRWQEKSTYFIVFIHHHEMTAAVAPDPNERLPAPRMFRQLHSLVGIRDRMPVDGLNHIAGLQSGLS